MRFRRIDSFRVHLAQSLQTIPFTLQLFPLSLWTGHLVPGGLASEDSRNLQPPDTEEPLQLQRLLADSAGRGGLVARNCHELNCIYCNCECTVTHYASPWIIQSRVVVVQPRPP